MPKSLLAVTAALGLGAAMLAAAPPRTQAPAGAPTIVVNLFTSKAGLDWPYDFSLLQSQTVKKIESKLKDKATVVTAAPTGAAKVYTVNGEIERMFQQNNLDGHAGGVESNDEIISVHYWLTDASGKKIFDKTRTYSEPSVGSFSEAQVGTAGPMAKDLESDIAGNLNGAKIY